MLEWVRKHLETVLGKTITGLIGVFILGAVSITALPRWLVTTDIFQNEVRRVYSEMSKGDMWRKFDIVQLQKDIWEQWLEELQDQLETQNISPKWKQLNRLEEIKAELEYLRNYEESLKTELEQYDKIHDILFTFKQPIDAFPPYPTIPPNHNLVPSQDILWQLSPALNHFVPETTISTKPCQI